MVRLAACSILFPDDWSSILVPDIALLEIFVRGSIVYLALFFGLRLIFQREAAGLGISDLLVVVLLADAVQNAMGNDYQSLPGGLLLAGTIMGWDWFLSYLAFRYPPIRRAVRPRPITLIRDGQVIEENLSREMVTYEELMGEIRRQGIEQVEDVRHAHMESNGVITAIPWSGRSDSKQRRIRGA